MIVHCLDESIKDYHSIKVEGDSFHIFLCTMYEEGNTQT